MNNCLENDIQTDSKYEDDSSTGSDEITLQTNPFSSGREVTPLEAMKMRSFWVMMFVVAVNEYGLILITNYYKVKRDILLQGIFQFFWTRRSGVDQPYVSIVP